MAVQRQCRECRRWCAERDRRCKSCGKVLGDKHTSAWRVDRVDGIGKRVRQVCGSYERAAVVDLDVRKAAQLGYAYGSDPERATLGVLCDEYLADTEIAKAKDYRVRRNFIRAIVRVLGEYRSLAGLSVKAINVYKRDRQAAGISGSTINRECRYLSVMLDWHAAVGRIQANPIKGYEQLDENAARKRVADPNELEAIATYLPAHDRPLVAVLAALPLRFHEALALQWEQSEKAPWLDLSGDRGYIVVPDGVAKSGRAREIPIYFAELRDMLAGLPSRFVKGAVFTLDGSTPLSRSRIEKDWRDARSKAGCPDLRIHDLKHTAITWLLLYGVPPHEVAYVSDHASASIQQRYANVQRDHVRAKRERWYNPATGMVEELKKDQPASSTGSTPSRRR